MSEGFPEAEYATRVAKAQVAMKEQGFGALLLTTEPDIRYFTGFLTRFWESPSRSWFLVVPVSGRPIAVIPSIGAALMGRTWVQDIRTWAAPCPEDDGVTLLADALRETGGPVALPMGYETHLRMPLADFMRVQQLSGLDFVADAGLVADLRAVKSPAEIARIENTCAIAGRAFAQVGEIAQPGVPLSQVFRNFQMMLLEEGAEWVPYLAGGLGPFGYDDVISPASDRMLAKGDVLMLDTGAVHQGYFCDYDRNFALGEAADVVQDAHRWLIEAVDAGFSAAKPGAEARDVWKAMADVTGSGEGAGRLGHGLGMQLTEGLSFTADDRTVLQPGMVLTLEPSTDTRDGCLLVHEENIVITETGARPLTKFSGPDIAMI